MSRWYCWNDYEHRDDGSRDARYGRRPDYDMADKARDGDACGEAYMAGYRAEERRQEDRRQEEAEERRSQARREEAHRSYEYERRCYEDEQHYQEQQYFDHYGHYPGEQAPRPRGTWTKPKPRPKRAGISRRGWRKRP